MNPLKTASPSKITLAVLLGMGLPLPALAQDAPPPPIMIVDTAIDPAALVLATQIVDLGYPEETREALFFNTMDQMMGQMRSALGPLLPEGNEGAVAVFDEWVADYISQSKDLLKEHIPTIMDGMAQSYANVFSVEELRDILAFVQTPSGQRYFELSPSILSDRAFADANQKYMDETVAMMRPAQEDLMERIRVYLDSEEPDT